MCIITVLDSATTKVHTVVNGFAYDVLHAYISLTVYHNASDFEVSDE